VNLASIIDPHDADAVALVSRGKPTTYGELREQVAHLRGGLAQLGVGPGDRVALLLSNQPQFVDALLAILGLGAIAVPLNPQNPAPAIEHELRDVEAKAVFVGSTSAVAFAAVHRAALPSVEHVIAVDATIDGAQRYEDVIGHEPAPAVDAAPDDLAVLLFTSGTAGAPRAAMLTHGNLLANIDQNLAVVDRISSSDVIFGVLPLHHIFGLNVMLLLTLAAGASVVLVMRFDPSTALDTIVERGVTVIPGAPPMWTSWAAMAATQPAAFSAVRLALTGAAKMPEDATEVLLQKFGLVLREGYGLTEASPVVTSSAGLEPRAGSIGKPIPGVTVRIVDEDGDDVPLGDAGELWVKGDNVFKGYWNDPVATARVLHPDGWLRTGDVGVEDDDGYLYLVDRAKDLIIVSGFNVYPAEVEDVLSAYPGVAEVAVVGVAHPHTGEAVKAYVVMREGSEADEEQLIAFCHDQLARYKCPTKVLFVAELPRGMTGKILRRVLR
jgi:long-chain acyl-CoA synthetase